MQYYRRKMFENHAGTIPEDSLRSYYDAHKADYRLDRPMVKGIYLKVPDDAANLRRLRKLYVSDKPDDIDRLEKEVLSSAIHYDYFCDRWVDWEQIETRIPADFGADPSQWLASGGRRIDTSVGGFTYLLRITAVLPAGSTMPFGQARQLVLQRMLASNRRAYDAELIRSLREEAIKSGRVSIAVPE